MGTELQVLWGSCNFYLSGLPLAICGVESGGLDRSVNLSCHFVLRLAFLNE